MANYIGQNDSFLDREGLAVDFATEDKLNKDFKVTIVGGASAKEVILFPSFIPSAASKVIATGTILSDVVCAGDPHSIEQFIAAIKANPTRVLNVRIQTTDLTMFSNTMVLVEKALGKKDKEEIIKIEKYVGLYQNNDKIVNVQQEFQLDNFHELRTTIPAGATVSFTFEFGFSLDTAGALAAKAQMAAKDEGVKAAKSTWKK